MTADDRDDKGATEDATSRPAPRPLSTRLGISDVIDLPDHDELWDTLMRGRR